MSEKEPVIVTCPPTQQFYKIKPFDVNLAAGENPISDKNLIKFLLLNPMKNAHIDHLEVIRKGHMTPNEVAALGYKVLDEKGNPLVVPIDTSMEMPEGTPDFALMGIRELKEWCDDDRHPVKYKDNWGKEDFLKAIGKAVEKKKSKKKSKKG